MKISLRICVLLLMTATWWSFSCSGDYKPHTLEGNLLDYKEADVVTFTISGNATCKKCEEEEIPIEAMQVEVYPKEGALDRLALKMYSGLGNFSMQNITAHAGQILQVEGKLLRQGATGWVTAAYGYSEVVVPDDDGDIVAITLIFPSSDESDD